MTGKGGRGRAQAPAEAADMHVRLSPDDVRKLEECASVERIELGSASRHGVSRSSVVRNAIAMYHEVKVLGYSKQAAGDVRDR